MTEPQAQVPLANWCTLEVGGPARWFVRATSERAIVEALDWAAEHDVAVLVLGGGSNVVIADEGFPGLVIQIAITGIDAREDGVSTFFDVGSGEPWDAFVAHTVDSGCAGLECLSGIPGLVGGTPVQNVGAYGQEVSNTIRSVHVIDTASRRRLTIDSRLCGFGYRTSRFKHDDVGRFIVTAVEYRLTQNGAPTITYADLVNYVADRGAVAPSLKDVRAAIIAIRSRKGMVIREGNPANKSCGSFFVNPIVGCDHFERIAASVAPSQVPNYRAGRAHLKVPAAWLIEQAGFAKGYEEGRVGLSPFQAQGLINRGGAAAEDVVRLAVAIKRAVWRRFGIALMPEPVLVGFEGHPLAQWLLNPAPEVA
jgi:UDP-N-acetylmuramate dehydrogenase